MDGLLVRLIAVERCCTRRWSGRPEPYPGKFRMGYERLFFLVPGADRKDHYDHHYHDPDDDKYEHGSNK